jgi:dipeptidyl aminopeptidase/acylaminoacyl peptidase
VTSTPSGGLYDVLTGRPKSVVPPIEGGPYNQRIHAVGLSPDGRRLVVSSTGSFLDKNRTWFTRRTAVWNVRDEKPVLERLLPDTGGNVTAFAFTPDGKALMVGHQSGEVAWWDMTPDPPKEVKRWRTRDADITALAVSPDGKELATGSHEIRRGKIGEPGTVVADKFGWAVYSGQLQFTPDGKLLAKIGGGFVVFDRAGKAVIDLRPDRGDCSMGGFSGFATTADGRYVALPTGNGLIYILRLGK